MTMDWPEALEIMVTRYHNAHFRVLCDEANPDIIQRDAYRALMVRQATGQPEPVPDPDPASAALQAHVAAHPCGSC